MKPYQEHQKAAPHDVKISIITVSTSKFQEAQKEKKVDDKSGALIRKMVEKTGYQIVSQKLIDDNIEMIRLTLLKSMYDDGAEAIIITGGTGISPRDVTIESVCPLFDKELEGFGEVFRNISFHQIGSPAQLSRATAGVIDNRIVYCVPGSPNAVEPALEIILPELPHAVSMARK
jgi:molybdenum cofactor biosynthesis protein B